MWSIQNRVFVDLKGSDSLANARRRLSSAVEHKNLTLVIGNGISQSSVHLHALQQTAHGIKHHAVGWGEVVLHAARQAKLDTEFITSEMNLLALAQAILERLEEDRGRKLLLDELQREFARPIPPTCLHNMMVDAQLPAVVTTNYDFQIERAYAERRVPWTALVRNVPEVRGTGARIYKMHGTLIPDPDHLPLYEFARDEWKTQPEKSVVIAESDYDNCLNELRSQAASPLLRSLENPCLIVGKGFSWQDLSFLYALRATRRERPYAYLVATRLTAEERLNLRNLGIIPLLVNMPARPASGHYYVGLAKALIELVPDIGQAYQAEVDDFVYKQGLLRPPHFVALGLASHNTIGRSLYLGSGSDKAAPKYVLPKAGRRNMRYEAEEHVGGAALIPTAVFAALDAHHDFNRSVISAIGEKDVFKNAILDFCDEYDIDVDGISHTADNTWRSIVLVHDSETHEGNYPGQRIFLDRGFEKPLYFDPYTLEQLKVQLDRTQPNLRLVYFDKFLALPYPYDSPNPGLLMEHQEIFENLVRYRDDVDIMYETGGGGSRGLVVENAFGRYVNILTAGFPFFAHNVVPAAFRTDPGPGMENFRRNNWYETEFQDETLAIAELLEALGLDPGDTATQCFTPPPAWITTGGQWAARNHSRRWMIATMHHYGALAIDLNQETGLYCPVQPAPGEAIQSTVGAGDSFRGAFCYILLKQRDQVRESDLLRCCTEYAVQMAAEKCRVFTMKEALTHLRELSLERE